MRLPTPCARDGKGPGHQYGLPDVVERRGLLPTPTAVSYGWNQSASSGAAVRPSLSGLVTRGLCTTSSDDDAGRRQGGHRGRAPGSPVLLPTPRGSDGAKGCPRQRGSHGDLTLPSAAVRVLPTPTVSDGRGPGIRRGGGPNLRTTVATLPTATEARWGGYAAAVARWEILMGRAVPEPTQPGTHGKPVLAPAFVEWLMGLPTGWVTDLPLPRTLALRVLGNGVVPQQAEAAIRLLLCPRRWAAGDG